MDKYEKYEPLKSHLRDLYENLDRAEEGALLLRMRKVDFGSEHEEYWRIQSTIDFVQEFYEKLVK